MQPRELTASKSTAEIERKGEAAVPLAALVCARCTVRRSHPCPREPGPLWTNSMVHGAPAYGPP